MRKQNLLRAASVSILLLLGVTACVSTSTSAPHEPLKQKVTVTVSSPDMPVKSNTPMSWARDLKKFSDDELVDKNREFYNWIGSEVQAQVVSKGFTVVDELASTRYQLVGVVVLSDTDKGQHAEELFKLFPSLTGESSDNPKGTLLLGILDTQTGQGVWRGAIQVFTNPEATVAESQVRVRELLQGLLKKLKPADA